MNKKIVILCALICFSALVWRFSSATKKIETIDIKNNSESKVSYKEDQLQKRNESQEEREKETVFSETRSKLRERKKTVALKSERIEKSEEIKHENNELSPHNQVVEFYKKYLTDIYSSVIEDFQLNDEKKSQLLSELALSQIRKQELVAMMLNKNVTDEQVIESQNSLSEKTHKNLAEIISEDQINSLNSEKDRLQELSVKNSMQALLSSLDMEEGQRKI